MTEPSVSLESLAEQMSALEARMERIENAVLSMVAAPASSQPVGRWHAIAVAVGMAAGGALEKVLTAWLGG